MKRDAKFGMKGFALGVLVTAVLMTSIWAFAEDYNLGDVICDVLYTDIVTYVDDIYIPSFNVDGYTAILVDDLAELGYDLQWYEDERVFVATSPWKQAQDAKQQTQDPQGQPVVSDRIVPIANCKWSSSFENNTGALSYDGNLSTMWAADGVGEWVWYELAETADISGVYVVLNKGAERKAMFDLQVSGDGENYTTVLSCTGSGTSEGELFTFSNPVRGKYFRFWGKGNNINTWNSIKEIEFRAKAQ